MIGLEKILGFIGVKPEAIAQLREMITPEKVAAGIEQVKRLEARLSAIENAVFEMHARVMARALDAPPPNPLMEVPTPGALLAPIDAPQDAPFDTSAGAQVAGREGETIHPTFQKEMDRQLALVLAENGVTIDDDGSSDGRDAPGANWRDALGIAGSGGSDGSGGD